MGCAAVAQVDKDGRGRLTQAQLHRFCRLIVPDVSPGQVDYLAVMLDHDGDGCVSFQVRCRLAEQQTRAFHPASGTRLHASRACRTCSTSPPSAGARASRSP